MTRKGLIIATALTAAIGITTLSLNSSTIAQPYGGWGMMGSGHGPGWMHRYGDEDGGYGPGWMGRRWSGQQGDLNLKTDDVKKRLERWLTWQDNPRLKLGDIKEKDADTIVADIVTKDNSLVQRFTVNRHTGYYRPSGE